MKLDGEGFGGGILRGDLRRRHGCTFIRRSRSRKRGSLRWKLRKAVKAVNQALGSLNLEKHPDKTFIGRIERGFDFLGYHFRPDRLSVAAKTIENFVARALRLYEQEPGEPLDSSRLGVYVQRWAAWAKGGLVEEATH